MGSGASKAASEAASVPRKYPSPSVAANAAAAPQPTAVPRPSPSAVQPPSPPPPPPVAPEPESIDALTPEEEAAVERDIRDRRVGATLAGIKFENVGTAVDVGKNVQRHNEMIDVVRGRLARSRKSLRNPYMDPSSTNTAAQPSSEPPRTRMLVTEIEEFIGFATRRKLARKEWTIEEAASKFKIPAKDAEALLKYFNVPTVEQGNAEGKLDGIWTEPDEKGRPVRPKA